MIKHLFKLVWNRKRANVLLVGEIFCSFLVLFTIVTFGMYYADKYRHPLGFSYDNVWSIFCLPNFEAMGSRGEKELGLYYQQIYRALQDFEEIEAVAGAESVIPYSLISTSYTNCEYEGGGGVETHYGRASDHFLEVLDLELLQGRWFDETDDALNGKSVVITQRLSRELFGDENPLGKYIQTGWSSGQGVKGDTDNKGFQVVGVVADFRRSGEFSAVDNYLFFRLNVTDPLSLNKQFPSHFLLEIRPGTDLALQEKLAARIQSITTDLRIEINTLEQGRASFFKWSLMPLWLGGIVAALLMVMVGLSLMGVLWQNVTQRTAEIGLRLAFGGVARNVYTQFIGEVTVVTTIGVALGVVLVVQFPLLDLISFVSNQVYVASLAVSSLLIYLLVVGCGLYPSRMATRIPPADALHYE